MVRPKKELIIDGLSGRPINDLIVGWVFTMREVAPYVFTVKAVDFEGRTLFGAGGNAEEALENCLKRVKRKIFIRRFFEELTNKVKILLGSKK